MAITTNLSEFASDFNSANTGVILKTPGGVTSVPEDYYAPYSYSNSAFSSANAGLILAQSAFNSANAEISLQSGINSTQNTHISAAFSKANSSITLGSTPLYLGSTNTSISGLTLTNPVIDGFTGNTGIIDIGSGQIYKDVSGNLGVGTNSPGAASGYTTLDVSNSTNGARIRCLVGSTAYGGMYTNGTTDFRIGSLAAVPLLVITGSNSIARFDTSGNFGLGVTPSDWNSNSKSMQIGSLISIESNTNGFINFGSNFYRDSVGVFKFIQNGYASSAAQYQGTHRWYTSITSGIAGNNWSPTQVMILDANGNLGIGATSPSAKLHIFGTGASAGIFIEDSSASNDSPVVRVRGNRSDNNGSQSFSGGLVLERYNSGSQLVTGNVLGTIYFGGNYSGSSFGYPASISATASSNWSSSSTANTDLIFLTGSTAQTSLGTPNVAYGTERIRIDAIGNIRMGDVSSTSDLGRYFDIYNLANGSSSFSILRFVTQQVSSTNSTSADILKNKAGAFVINNNETNSAAFTAFGVGGAERMRIDSSGNAGIGTSSPAVKLDVVGIVRSTGLSLSGGGVTGGTTAFSAGTISTDTNWGMYFRAPTGSSSLAEFAWVNAAGTERLRIDSSGNLLVGTTSAVLTSGQGVKILSTGRIFQVLTNNEGDTLGVYNTTAGAWRFYVTTAGTVYATNTTIAAISDQRLKENVQDLDVGIDAILALKPRKFDWKEGKGKDIKGDRGFIAQEFEEVFPDLVDDWKDEPPEGEEPYKSVRPDLIPVIVKAIQELHAELESQKALNQSLLERIIQLEAK